MWAAEKDPISSADFCPSCIGAEVFPSLKGFRHALNEIVAPKSLGSSQPEQLQVKINVACD